MIASARALRTPQFFPTNLVAGVVPLGIDVLTAYVPSFRSGQLLPIAVTSISRGFPLYTSLQRFHTDAENRTQKLLRYS